MVSQHFIVTNNHPLLYYTAAFAAGIFAQSLHMCIVANIAFCALLIVLIWLSYKKQSLTNIICTISLIAGAASYQYQITKQTSLSTMIANNEFEIMGTISNVSEVKNSRATQVITVNVEKLKYKTMVSTWIKTHKTVQLYITRKTTLCVGDFVHIKKLLLKKEKSNSYGFYLLKEQIDASLFAHELSYELIKRPRYSVTRFFHSLRTKIVTHAKRNLNPETFALFSSIFLGNKVIEKKRMANIKEQYAIWGVSHYLARSGLHLVIIIVLWDLLLNFVSISFLFKQIILILLTTLYHCCSWSSVSFLRAFMIFILYKLCVISKKPIRTLHLLSIVTLGVLFVNPVQLFFLDFQLSFGLTYALAWFNDTHKTKN